MNCPYCSQETDSVHKLEWTKVCPNCPGQPRFLDWNATTLQYHPDCLQVDFVIFTGNDMFHLFYYPNTGNLKIDYHKQITDITKSIQYESFLTLQVPILLPNDINPLLQRLEDLKAFL